MYINNKRIFIITSEIVIIESRSPYPYLTLGYGLLFFIKTNMEKHEQGYYYIIPADLIENGNKTKAVLYGVITSLTLKQKYCTASNQYLANKLGLASPTNISKYITELKDDGWLKVRLLDKNRREILPLLKFQKSPSEKSEAPPSEKSEESNKRYSNKNSSKGNKVSKPNKKRGDIDNLLNSLVKLIGPLDGTKIEQRRYAKNFLDSKIVEILKASGNEEPTEQQKINATLRIFQLAQKDSFHSKWSNSMGYVYRKAISIITSQNNNKPKIAIIT